MTKATCPYCGNTDCECDEVDIGVGVQQSGPYHCERCGAFQYNRDDVPKTGWEKKTGWHEPDLEIANAGNDTGPTAR